jgi:zinc protease
MRRLLISLVATTSVLAVSLLAHDSAAQTPAPAKQAPAPAVPTTPPATPPRPATVSMAATTMKLANGLEVIFDEDHRTPIVTTNVWYHVGSKDEAEHRNGFAHLFEHVMFQGSKHVPEDTYFRFLERAGATSINGTTNTDRTNYFETVPSNQLELALWLESDRMAFLLSHADEKTFQSQREVVKNERRQNYENAPYGMVSAFVRAEVYPSDHPYHLLTIGSPEDLDAATFDDVKQFFRTNYVPNNATLVISGDFERAKVAPLVEKWFGPIVRGREVPRKKPIATTLLGETRLEVEAGVELARAYVTWPTPRFFAPGDAELDLVSHVLTGSKTSRLYKRLVYDLQIAQSVQASQQSSELGSVFEISATARPGHTGDELLKVIDEELAKLRSGGITDPELSRAATSITADTLFDLERSSSRANRLNTYAHYIGDPNYLAKDMARTTGATPTSVADAARTWLKQKDRVVTLVTPNRDAPIAGRITKTTRGGK